MLRDAGNSADGEKVTFRTAIKGTSGFSSGRHYWEVSLEKPNVGLKKSWWVGVTSAAVIPHESDLPLTASNDFWFLSSSDKEGILQIHAGTNVLPHVSSRPRTLGVFLNYDSGELSFYNVEEKRLIASVTTSFTGEVFPFFNPGKGDKAPMEILHQSSNSVIETQPA